MNQFRPALRNLFCTSCRYSLLKIILIGFCFFTKLYSQNFRLKKDSVFIENYQIELYGTLNQIFVSAEGAVEIPLQSINSSDSLLISDLNQNIHYSLHRNEVKIHHTVLSFSTGKIIETVVLSNKKKESLIGITDTGSSSKLYMKADAVKIVEIPENQLNVNKKIKKIRYYFSGGRHPVSGVKIDKENTKIIPVLFTCDAIDCKNPERLIPDIEVNFEKGSKYLEIDVSHRNIMIDENFKNIYIGFFAKDSFVMKMKKTDKIGENKCYNAGPELEWFREATYHCPVIFLVVE